MNIVYFLLGLVVGGIVIIYTPNWVKIFGHLSWAERLFGPGGTYMAWKLIGLAAIIAGFLALRFG